MTRLPDLQIAIHAAAWGIGYLRLLTLRDPVALALEREVVIGAVEQRIRNEEALAIQVGNAVARALAG